MSKSIAERSRCAISDPREREAIALLAQAGWTHAELAMTFQVGEDALVRLLEQEGLGDE